MTEPIDPPDALDERVGTEVAVLPEVVPDAAGESPEAGMASEPAILAAAPPPPSTSRRIRSVSALAIAVVIVIAGVLITLGGVDALVRGRSPTTSPQPTPARTIPSGLGSPLRDVVA